MSRGKHKTAATRRRVQAHDQTVSTLLAELVTEQARLEQVQVQERELGTLREELARAESLRDQRTAAEIGRLDTETDILRDAVDEQARISRPISELYDRVCDDIIRAGGGRVDGLELLLKVVAGGGSMLDGHLGRLGSLASQRLQRARGERGIVKHTEQMAELGQHEGRALRSSLRHHALAEYEELLTAEGFTRPGLTDEQLVRLAELDAITDRVGASTYASTDAVAWASWHPLQMIEPVGRYADSPLAKVLGVPDDVDPFAGARPVPHRAAVPQPGQDWSAARRDSLALLDPFQVVPDWAGWVKERTSLLASDARDLAPWANPPDFPTPQDALAVQLVGLRAAAGEWLTSAYLEPSGEADLGQVAAWGQITGALAGAVPFWLPPGHAAAYLDSEELTAADVEELRLPYPQVLVTFADPVTLPPVREASITTEQARCLAELDVHALRLHSRDAPNLARYWIEYPGEEPPNGDLVGDDVAAVRGARVDGVLLLADARGQLRDRCAWLLSLPGRHGGVISRHVVIADIRTSGQYAALLNLAAVTAWGDWHPAAQLDPSGPSSAEARREWMTAGGPGGVRVLDVTSQGGGSRSDGSGRTMAPHMRRGHWRRQHFGPANSLTKRVRISPVLVNAGKGEMTPAVYRLPLI